jgi:hypothetical protein
MLQHLVDILNELGSDTKRSSSACEVKKNHIVMLCVWQDSLLEVYIFLHKY